MRINRKTALGVGVSLAALFLSLSSQAGPEPKEERLSRSGLENMLLAAAEERGIGITADSTLTLVTGKHTLVAAPIQDFANTPATDLPSGADAAFAFLSERRGLPAGFYTIRVTAPEVQLGKVKGTVQFVDREGAVVAEREATIFVHSLSVPEDVRPNVNIVNSAELGEPGETQVASRTVWILCSNGQWICFEDDDESALA